MSSLIGKNLARPRRCRVRILGPLLTCASSMVFVLPSAHANWATDGVPVCTESSDQRDPAVCSDGAGGVIVAWSDDRGTAFRVYAQRLDASGSPQWTPDGVPVCNTTGVQFVSAVLSDAEGGALIAWSDHRNGNDDVYVQRLTAAGTIAPGWPVTAVRLSTDSEDEGFPRMASDGAGGAIVVWTHYLGNGPTLESDVYASRVTASGSISPGWPTRGVPLTQAGYYQLGSSVVSDDAGGAFVVWEDFAPSAGEWADVYATRITASGIIAPGWGSNGNPLCSTSWERWFPRLVPDDSGGAIVTWVDCRNGSGESDIWAQRMTGSGAMLWGPNGVSLCDAPSMQWNPQMVSDGAGGAMVAWRDERWLIPSAIYGQRLNPDGMPYWQAGGIPLSQTPADGGVLAATADGDGGMITAWIDARQGPANYDLYGQHVTGDGRLAWSRIGQPLSTAPAEQMMQAITSDGGRGGIIAWEDRRNGNTDIYANQVTAFSNLDATLTPLDWPSPAVPRNEPVGSGGGVSLTPVLDGNEPTTWINWATAQQGPNPMPPWRSEVWLDESPTESQSFDVLDNNEPGLYVATNMGPTLVRGGRHSLAIHADPADDMPEDDEEDNTWRGQWVWSPGHLERAVPAVRPIPPFRGFFPQPNCDGFRFMRPNPDRAWVVSIAARAQGDNYDLYVYDDYAGSTSGFSNLLGVSECEGNATDFVVGHAVATPATVYPGAVLYSDAGGGSDFSIDATDSEGRRGVDSAQWLQQELGADRLADVYEVYLEVGGYPYSFTLVREQGVSDLEFHLYGPIPGGVYDRSHPMCPSTPLSPSVDQLNYVPAMAGWYPLVVLRTTGDDAALPVVYSFSMQSGAEDAPPPAGALPELSFARPVGNPSCGRAVFSFSLSRAGVVRLELFDLQGRLVRRLLDGPRQAGRQEQAWDCRNEAGLSVAPGIYWARLGAEGRGISQPVVVVR